MLINKKQCLNKVFIIKIPISRESKEKNPRLQLVLCVCVFFIIISQMSIDFWKQATFWVWFRGLSFVYPFFFSASTSQTNQLVTCLVISHLKPHTKNITLAIKINYWCCLCLYVETIKVQREYLFPFQNACTLRRECALAHPWANAYTHWPLLNHWGWIRRRKINWPLICLNTHRLRFTSLHRLWTLECKSCAIHNFKMLHNPFAHAHEIAAHVIVAIA